MSGLTILPFAPEDAMDLMKSARETTMARYLGNIDLSVVATGGPCSTVFWHGQPIAASGLIEMHRHRAAAWLLMKTMPFAALVGLIRAMRGALNCCPYRRVEAHVDLGFAPGHRMAALLGFKIETRCKPHWFPHGGATEYVRLRPE